MTVEDAERIVLTVGPPAHGGHCVARYEGQVVFVRHALPGERVVAEVTETHRGFARADAVEIIEAAPARVEPPCPYARPDRCGGCDLQHVAPQAQRDWKTAVLREQLERLGGLDPAELAALDLTVRAVPGGSLGWRSRMRYAVDAADRAGLRKHRSHEVVPVDRCLIAHPAIRDLPVLASTGQRWPDADEVLTVASSAGDVAIRALRPDGARTVRGPETIAEVAAGREWRLPADGFWQVHPAAADTLTATVRDLLRPVAGETAWDLYGGAGLFAGALAGALGARGRVQVVEADPDAVAAARQNLADLSGVEVVHAPVERALRRRRISGPVDLVVLDPPRAGAGRAVTEAVVGSGARAVAYVACDPAAFARDVRTFRTAGWRLAEVRAYDLFPMTQHLECVGLLLP
ncbi:class I SAM-dependent RNA methyltransferase [Plantactinospora sp. KBS50]|uniref:class I SAM-dependent RNA methyltransferase n=1 Tax=Plantactinospora sp. KBS50 TaxID=2024580 RepID=UPI000BAB0554|nr:TRAM domain-containing protein [Plantactinospora sp. KBS50]ASW54184.1 tRNA/tmRNA/rRNA uracil-C5-methylase [Plantactinospora sp. KBS50]